MLRRHVGAPVRRRVLRDCGQRGEVMGTDVGEVADVDGRDRKDRIKGPVPSNVSHRGPDLQACFMLAGRFMGLDVPLR